MERHSAKASVGQVEQSEMKRAALKYAAEGWHVMPCIPGDKAPLGALVPNGYKDATDDPEKIKAWWTAQPSANIGLVPVMSGRVVVDADTYKDGCAFPALAALHGFPETLMQRSARGGTHYVLTAAEGAKYPGTLGEATDVKFKGYFLAAPSVVDGKSYHWLNDAPIAAAPEWMARPQRSAAEVLGNPQADDGTTLAEVEEALRHIPADCSYGAWLEILQALHHGFGADALTLADEWSMTAPHRYQEGLVDQKFASFRASGDGPQVTLGTLFKRAKANGADLAAIRSRHFDAGKFFAMVPEAERGETVVEQRLAMERAEYQAAQADGLGKADVKAAPDFPHDPVDLWGRFDPPALPADLLPRVIEDFARIQGNQMGADPAGIAVAALVTSAAAIPDGVRLKLKRHDRWSESARLWAALVGTPSTKKSPILSVATEPLCEIDNNLFREWQAQKTLWDGLDKKERKGREEPKQRRLRLGDTTPEAAQMVLENSPDGVLLLQDELSGFFGAMDKYNGGKGASADRAFWLQSFNGGQYALNRAGRGSALIPNLSVCLLGGIQPEPIRKVAGDTNDDGLLQRLFPIVLRPATMGRDEPAADVVGEYGALVRRLNQLVPTTAPLMFDDGAMKIREGLERKHLELQTTEIVNRKLASHVGKYDGLFARLCIVWHCIEHAYAPKLPGVVSKATAERVGAFLHGFLLKHAFAFYGGVLGLSDDHDDLTAIAGHILSKRLEKVAHRDVQRGTQSMKKLTERDTRPLFEQLAAIGWLEKIDGPRPSSAPHWLVNPLVHVRFADHAAAERDRRARAREVLTSLGQSEQADLDGPDLLEEAAIFG